MNQAIGKAQLFLVCCVGTLVLLNSPTLAQVNGPGTSPSELFDTVLNLPGDEAVIAGFIFESVGGIAGQTTQLNVNDDGDLGGYFEALSGSEVNINGGSVDRLFSAQLGSEVNISDGFVGRYFDAGTGSVVNITGGTVSNFFEALSGSAVNITGGTVGSGFEALSGSVVTISGGNMGVNFTALSGSAVNISGGAFGHPFSAVAGSDVELIGGEFRLNGTDFSGSTITLADGDVFTGTLADGSSFIFSHATSDELANVTLTASTLPPADPSPITINAPVASGPSGLRAGQTLTLQTGGSLPHNFAIVNATLNVEDGEVGQFAEAYNSVVNISGGDVARDFTAFDGSVVRINGGRFGNGFTALDGSKVHFSGGDLQRTFSAQSGSAVKINGGTLQVLNAMDGSQVNISGGTVIDANAKSGSAVNISGGTVGISLGNLSAESGSVVNISGGSVSRRFSATDGSDVELIGGEFRLNGADFSGSTITLADDDVFTGTLADGSSFIFSDAASDELVNVSLTNVVLPAIDLSPNVINTPVVSGSSGLRTGQTLSLEAGGSLRENFAIIDATLNVLGGHLGEWAEAAGSVVNISGGITGLGLSAFDGSVVNISGGAVGSFFVFDSEVTISGGTVGTAYAYNGSVVNIRGVDRGVNFKAFDGSVVNISGGEVERGVNAESGSAVNIFGSAFSIDGDELEALVPGEAFTITDRGVTLSGFLADGEQFSFVLNPRYVGAHVAWFEPDATLTVTLVSPASLGDVNLNGVIDLSDIPTFIAILATGAYRAQADCNQDGVVNFLDIHPFIQILLSA